MVTRCIYNKHPTVRALLTNNTLFIHCLPNNNVCLRWILFICKLCRDLHCLSHVLVEALSRSIQMIKLALFYHPFTQRELLRSEKHRKTIIVAIISYNKLYEISALQCLVDFIAVLSNIEFSECQLRALTLSLFQTCVAKKTTFQLDHACAVVRRTGKRPLNKAKHVGTCRQTQ